MGANQSTCRTNSAVESAVVGVVPGTNAAASATKTGPGTPTNQAKAQPPVFSPMSSPGTPNGGAGIGSGRSRSGSPIAFMLRHSPMGRSRGYHTKKANQAPDSNRSPLVVRQRVVVMESGVQTSPVGNENRFAGAASPSAINAANEAEVRALINSHVQKLDFMDEQLQAARETEIRERRVRNALEADLRGAKEELAKARIAARTAEATAASTKTRLQLVEIELSELKQDQSRWLTRGDLSGMLSPGSPAHTVATSMNHHHGSPTGGPSVYLSPVSRGSPLRASRFITPRSALETSILQTRLRMTKEELETTKSEALRACDSARKLAAEVEETRHEVEGERVIKAKALKILNDMKPEYIRIKEENEALKAEVEELNERIVSLRGEPARIRRLEAELRSKAMVEETNEVLLDRLADHERVIATLLTSFKKPEDAARLFFGALSHGNIQSQRRLADGSMMTLGGDRKTWKAKHYALMPNGFLVFHSKRGDKKPKGVRILAHCTVGPWEGWGLEHVFRIDGIEPAAVQAGAEGTSAADLPSVANSRKTDTLFIRAADDDERDEWIDMLLDNGAHPMADD